MVLELNTKEPIYLQIIAYMKKKIVSGELKGGERVLSVREYASEVKVNPNTIQKVYNELENQGLIYTQRGIGKFVTEDKEKRWWIQSGSPSFCNCCGNTCIAADT